MRHPHEFRPFRTAVLALTLAATAFLVACSDLDDGSGLDPLSQMSGSWSAEHFIYENAAGGEQRVDVVEDVGGSFAITIQSSGSFSGSYLLPDFDTGEGTSLPVTGTISVQSQSTLRINFSGPGASQLEDMNVDYQLTSSRLLWESDDVSFDFTPHNGQADAVPATLVVEMRRD